MDAIREIEAGRICPTAPDVIWLQSDPECSEGDTPVYPGDNIGEVTWCWHDINDSDTKYVRADIYVSAIAAREAEIKEAGLKYVSLFGELQGAMEEIAKLRAALHIIKSQSIADDWTAAEALGFVKSHASAALTTTPQPPRELK